MSSARILCLALAVPAAALATSGCRSVELSARESSVPVLLGPVRSVGGPAPATRPVGAFGTETRDVRRDASVSISNGREVVVLSTIGSGYRTPDGRARWDLEAATRGDDRSTIELHETQCGGHLFILLAGVFNFAEAEAWCRAKGTVRRAASASEP